MDRKRSGRGAEVPAALASLLNAPSDVPRTLAPLRGRIPPTAQLVSGELPGRSKDAPAGGDFSLLRNLRGRTRVVDDNPPTVVPRRRSLPEAAGKYMPTGPVGSPVAAAAVHRPTVFADPHEDSSDGRGLTDCASVASGPPDGGKRIGRIKVAVRKRPIPPDDCDVVDVFSPEVHVNATKQRVDLSEYTEAYQYAFDDAFDSHHDNEFVYDRCGRPLIDVVFGGGSASCFAYGQTGSGKTHTMLGTDDDMGMYLLAAKDIFERTGSEHSVSVSLYEIYCNSLFDLLNHRAVVIPREDSNRRVNICNLTWHEITTVSDLSAIIDRGAVQRRVGSTSANEFSSRSHAVLTIAVRNDTDGRLSGTLKLVDLAGSERAADTAANDRQTRLEGAEINKSLLALKECIRGLDERKKHIPFRGSKLTEVLRDSFVGNSRTVMIATISPATGNVDHTLNTLRYAFRVKGLTIENIVPSKDRKAPPKPRSKSVEPDSKLGTPQPETTSVLGMPLPPIVQPKKRRKKMRSRLLDPIGATRGDRAAGLAGIESDELAAFRQAVQGDIAGLREEMRMVIGRKDKEIEELSRRNADLERRLARLQVRLEPIGRVPSGSASRSPVGRGVGVAAGRSPSVSTQRSNVSMDGSLSTSHSPIDLS